MIQERGFTIIEVLVSITVFLTVVTAPMALSSVLYQRSMLTDDEISARLYSEETIEYVRYLKDTNVKNSKGWLYGDSLENCINKVCFVEVEDVDPSWVNGFTEDEPQNWSDIEANSPDLEDQRYILGCNREVDPDSLTDEDFIRTMKITIDERSGFSAATLVSCVLWKNKRDVVRTQIAEEIIYEWLGV